ncbi:hypothetical protein GJ496_003816 [Pomphorhynchus laevis]|nr:hypothetical protein GJ496_003816 [Pomphorhynchus laevis]
MAIFPFFTRGRPPEYHLYFSNVFKKHMKKLTLDQQFGILIESRAASQLSDINEFISCFICNGYLINATTLTDCLHTFCKSCILKHMASSNLCPKCSLTIEHANPEKCLVLDRTLHDLIYKIVPNLKDSEIKNEMDFCNQAGESIPTWISDHMVKPAVQAISIIRNLPVDTNDNVPLGKKVAICLEPEQPFPPIALKYVACSCDTTVDQVKKLLALKLFDDLTRYKELYIYCDDNLIGGDHSLNFIRLTVWKEKKMPIMLNYACDVSSKYKMQ